MCDSLMDSVCRLCLKEDFSLISVFSSRSPSGQPVYEVLNYIYGLKILQGDGFPPQICVPCLWKVLEFDTYKRNVYNAEAEIKQLLSKAALNPVEIPSEERDERDVLGEEETPMSDASEAPEDLVNETVSIKQEIFIEEWKMPEDIQHQKDALEVQSCGTDHRLNGDVINIRNDLVAPDVLSTNNDVQNEEEQPAYDTRHEKPEESEVTIKMEEMEILKYSSRGHSSQEQLTSSGSCERNYPGVGGESFEREETGSYEANIPRISDFDSYEGITEKGVEGCGRLSESGENLEERTGKIQEKDKPFVCNVCERGFWRKLDLGRHAWNHTGYKPFKCGMCGKGFTRRDVMVIHERTHFKEMSEKASGKKRYSCDVCAKRYNSEITLKRHSNLHKNTFLCPICGKCLSSNFNLKNHMRVHSDVHPYACEFCEKKFKTKHGKTDHEAAHHRID